MPLPKLKNCFLVIHRCNIANHLEPAKRLIHDKLRGGVILEFKTIDSGIALTRSTKMV
jgi:hypothetical protein